MDEIYEMKLGDVIEKNSYRFGQTKIERVPGGWNYIYTQYTGTVQEKTPITMTAVFVPLSNEFQE